MRIIDLLKFIIKLILVVYVSAVLSAIVSSAGSGSEGYLGEAFSLNAVLKQVSHGNLMFIFISAFIFGLLFFFNYYITTKANDSETNLWAWFMDW